jgi:di/tricarboxylate transporter
MSDAAIALTTLAVVIGLFVVNRLPVGVVAIATALSLWLTGLLEFDEAVAGFGDPVVIFIATLFVVSEAVDSSGLTTWAGQRVMALAGTSRSRVLLALMLLCAVLTALISLNGSVAALLPMAVMLAMRLGLAPSRVLMPMVYAGSAGSLLVLMGSPVNVIVSEASDDAGEGPFGFFEFAALGVPILFATVVIGILLADRVLPERRPVTAPPDLSRHAEALASEYQLRDGFYRLRVRQRSSFVGCDAASLDLGDRPGLRLVAVQGADDRPRRGEVAVDDVLVVTGPSEQVSSLVVDTVLAVTMTPVSEGDPGTLVNREAGVAEVVVPPRSPLIGDVVFAGMRRATDLVILAVQRAGRDQADRPVTVGAGDSLLVYGAWPALDALTQDRDVLVVDSPDLMRRQAVPLGATAGRAALTLAGMVLLLAFGLVPPAAAGLLAVVVLVLTGVVGSAQAYRAVSWETVVLVGGLIPLSTAIQASGAGDDIADLIVGLVGDGSPVMLMAVLFVVTGILGIVISNTATVLIVLPVGLAVAAETGYSVQPILMLLAVAASAAMLTPVQTPGNMMVMAPAGYRFGDYWRLGLPIMAAWLAICLVVIPFVWPFSP